MEIEKTLTVSAPREQVWALLLDPQVMGGAVPGMKSIEVISPTEYVAVMHQKISFISAKFKLRTHIVEQRPPEYLRAEGTGEDASVASSLKQQSEVFLTPTPDGGTELRIKVTVDVLGRLGTFGLSVMKTKADRMWDEFGANLKARLESGGVPAGPSPDASGAKPPAAQSADAPRATAQVSAPAAAPTQPLAPPAPPPPANVQPGSNATLAPPPQRVITPETEGSSVGAEGSWWSRLMGHRPTKTSGPVTIVGRSIRVEIRQADKTVAVDWPVEDADACKAWLREVIK